MTAPSPQSSAEPTPPPSSAVRSNCPDCKAGLTVLRIIPGRGAEYWTMRCTRCGGIHLDIVKPASLAQAVQGPDDLHV